MMRYLRYGAACVFALMAIALIGMWVRSYSHLESLCGMVSATRFVGFHHAYGNASFRTYLSPDEPPREADWNVHGQKIGGPVVSSQPSDPLYYGHGVTYLGLGQRGMAVASPYWFLVAVSAALAACTGCWRSKCWRRFSLRRLLVTMTVLAAVMGFAVYLSS